MKAAGWMFGEFGDIILTSTLCRTFKELNPNSELILCAHKKYSNVLPLFYNNPFVDGFHLWQGINGDDWLCEKDLEYVYKEKFDLVYTAKPQHKDNLWYQKGIHQIDEIHDMYNFAPPANKQCYLEKWFDLLPGQNNVITASVFASGNHPNQLARTFSPAKLRELFLVIESYGYKIVRLDTREEPELEDYWPASKLSLIDAAKILASSKLHLTCDTSWSWIADSYSHNTIGWTRSESYVPVNPNGHYFVADNINDIPIEKIIELIKQKI